MAKNKMNLITSNYVPNIKRALRTIIYLISSVFSITCFAFSSENSALKYYKLGESAYSEGHFETAIEYYNKAISFHDKDGDLITDQKIITNFISQGRTSKKTELIREEKKPYYPNQRIKILREILVEQYREAHPPKILLKWISMEDPSGNNILDGGETSTIAVEISNTGESAALNVQLAMSMNNSAGLDFNRVTKVGKINPDQTILKKLHIDVFRNVPEITRQLNILALEKGGFNSNTLEVHVQSKPHEPEKIIITNLVVEDLSGDSLIEPTEMIIIKAILSNIGKGVSNPLSAKLELGNNVYVPPDEEKEIQLGKIFPGENIDVKFSFLTNNNFVNNQHIPVKLVIHDDSENKVAMSDPSLNIFVPNKSTIVNVIPRQKKITLPHEQLVDVDVHIPEGITKKPNGIAVIIGNRNYKKKGLPRVEYAINDARIMKKYLIKTLGYDENNILYYEDATTANFTELFGTANDHKGRLSNMLKQEGSELFVYYSGHGAPDINTRNSFFVPVDADPNYVAFSGYSLAQFYKNISKTTTKNITIVLDTCFSGNSDGGYLLSSISPAMINLKKSSPNLKNAIIFSSTEIGQVSAWFHEKKHGLFTYYFLKGLSGSADKDSNNIVTSTELGVYLEKFVPYQARRLNGFEQNPVLLQTKNHSIVKLQNSVVISPKIAESQ